VRGYYEFIVTAEKVVEIIIKMRVSYCY